ncbi:DUF3667 domain-containing protein [Mucilaginibacter sp. 14171R-50]|uniref:DUF3667 domain-containing protein n=1 Tax=Mucilaginibacter sp. 14171R-50 TaxID=2703789 RepID=UPI00138C87BB|nr:DUF3667 domain-containing protein [Mucilaginibacter sp. 14171R-50]QHS54604.1 DUF3667 domain-containing protein [Mucilaginibacter sp. 14171R-50]
MPACKNCNTEIDQNYCSNCGQPAVLKRIDAHYIAHEIEHILHFERGILFTVKELLIRPGENVRDFISENRSRLVKPVIFIIVTSLIYTVINHFFHIEDGYVKVGDTRSAATDAIFEWIANHYGYSNIMMGMFIALWAKIFFKKYNYNFFEILILLCFIMGMGMLIFTLFAIVQGITHISLVQAGGYVGVLYCAWAIGQFFDQRKVSSYFKALGAYILGMVTFFVISIIIGTVIDQVIKH